MTWPYLRAMRWSDEEAARYYACGAWDRRGLDAMLAEHARDTPDKLAFHDGRAAITFAELDERARGLATGLRDRGVGVGAVVAVRMGNTVDHAVLVHALAAAGAVLFELPPDATPVQVTATLRRTSAVAFVADTAPTPAEAAALNGPALVTTAPHELARAPADDLPWQDPDAVSLLIGTSGTTGTPKLVMRTTNGSMAMSRNVVSRTGVERDSVAMVAAPLSGGVGYINSLCTPAVTGCSIILAGDFRAGALLREIERHGVTELATLPTLVIRMAAAEEAAGVDASALRTIQTGGAYLHPEVAATLEARFGCHVVSAYGAMDVGIPTMVAAHGDTVEHRHTTVGTGFPETEHRIVDDAGATLPDGEIGEVVMRGPSTALGYYADEEATRVLFDEHGWGHFGDLGLIDGDGYLRIVGRLKDVINRGGKKISVNEVEDHVRAFPGVIDVAAVGYDDPELGERCAIVVVTRDGLELTLDALREFLAARGAPKHIWPERIEHFDELPVSPQGKVRRRELRELIQKETTC
jgi:acyl-CoA synthetase (AMP-forming)/AMP-acid ligase II